HGLAGSGAVVVLVAASTTTVAGGLGWIVLFGLGSMVGMGLLSALVAAPLRGRLARLAPVSAAIEVLLGLGTIAIGVRMVLAQVA
ncbi:MAG TPA: urease accessory protein, partial [Vicinamibacteria bacterium]|nr:urease accessory protein [Vicinamibacteria bacterium]